MLVILSSSPALTTYLIGAEFSQFDPLTRR